MSRPFDPSFTNQRTRKNVGRVAEKRSAKRLGVRAQPGSGATEGAKGDIKLPTLLVECKSTQKESFSLKREWLHKIYKEAREVNREPVLQIMFVDNMGRAEDQDDWVVIPARLWNEIT